MKPYIFFEVGDGQGAQYFDVEECEDAAAALVCAQAIMRRDRHAVEIWDGLKNTLVVARAEGRSTGGGAVSAS